MSTAAQDLARLRKQKTGQTTAAQDLAALRAETKGVPNAGPAINFDAINGGKAVDAVMSKTPTATMRPKAKKPAKPTIMDQVEASGRVERGAPPIPLLPPEVINRYSQGNVGDLPTVQEAIAAPFNLLAKATGDVAAESVRKARQDVTNRPEARIPGMPKDALVSNARATGEIAGTMIPFALPGVNVAAMANQGLQATTFTDGKLGGIEMVKSMYGHLAPFAEAILYKESLGKAGSLEPLKNLYNTGQLPAAIADAAGLVLAPLAGKMLKSRPAKPTLAPAPEVGMPAGSARPLLPKSAEGTPLAMGPPRPLRAKPSVGQAQKLTGDAMVTEYGPIDERMLPSVGQAHYFDGTGNSEPGTPPGMGRMGDMGAIPLRDQVVHFAGGSGRLGDLVEKTQSVRAEIEKATALESWDREPVLELEYKATNEALRVAFDQLGVHPDAREIIWERLDELMPVDWEAVDDLQALGTRNPELGTPELAGKPGRVDALVAKAEGVGDFDSRLAAAKTAKSAEPKAGKIGFSVEVNTDIKGRAKKLIDESIEGKDGWGAGLSIRPSTVKIRQDIYKATRPAEAAGARLVDVGKRYIHEVRKLSKSESVYVDELAQTADKSAFDQLTQRAQVDPDVDFRRIARATNRIKHFENYAGRVYEELGVIDAETRTKWQDRHLRRSFFAHLREEDWLQQLGRTDPEKAQRIRSEIESANSPLGKGSSRKLHARNEDLSQEAQDFLKRVDDVETRFAQDVETLANITAARKAQSAIAKAYGKSSFAEAKAAYGDDVLEIASEIEFEGGGKRPAKTYYGDMAGKWFPGVVVRDVMVRPNLLDMPPAKLRSGIGYIRSNLVSWNPKVLVTNMLSNAPLAYLGTGVRGLNPVNWATSLREALAHSVKGSFQPDFKAMSKQVPDLLQSSLKQEVADAAMRAFDATSGPPARKMIAALKVALKSPSDLYGFMDKWSKLAAYKALKQAGKSDAEAALGASRALFDYGDKPRAMRVASNYGISYFPTFLYKVSRQMIKHPLRTGALAATYYGTKAAIESRTPTDKREKEKRLLGSAARGIRVPGKEPRYVDAENILPWSNIVRDAPTGTLGKVSGLMGAPGAIMQMPFFRGTDFYTGKRIEDDLVAWGDWALNDSGAVPGAGILRGIGEVDKAKRGGRTYGSRPLTPGEAALGAFTPARVLKPVVSEHVKMQQSSMAREIRDFETKWWKRKQKMDTAKAPASTVKMQTAVFEREREKLQRKANAVNKRLGTNLTVPRKMGGGSGVSLAPEKTSNRLR